MGASPLFDKITIRLNEQYYPGKEFVITTKGEAAAHPYVEQFVLNGKPLDTVRLPFSEIAKGGNLEVVMSDSPTDRYGNKKGEEEAQ